MLNKLDLSLKLNKKNYEERLDYFSTRLGELQRACREAKIPIVILVEGWRGAMRSAIINTMMQQMDARGFRVYSASKMSEAEKAQPFFTSYWKQLPVYGGIAVYHRSWYFMKHRGDYIEGEHSTSYEHINAFEKQLTDDGYVVLKFFVHISHKKQKDNLKKYSDIYKTVLPEFGDAKVGETEYKNNSARYERTITETNTESAHWHLIEGEDDRYAKIKVFETIEAELVKALERKEDIAVTSNENQADKDYDVLNKVDLSKSLTKEEYKKEFDKCKDKLKRLQLALAETGKSMILAFEGWDAAGKGGAIKRLTKHLDPLGYTVNPVASPNDLERQYHYLWRFWRNIPPRGEIAVFDRTWYGRVMVERVEHFASDAEWQRAYDEINETEKQWTEDDIIVCKFWLHIDKDEQYRRFKERENNDDKTWKITDEDWRNRDKWQVYEDAVNEMLVRTNTDYAPWTVVEGNSKYYARIKVVKTVINAMEKAMKQ